MADFGFPGPLDDMLLALAALITSLAVIWKKFLKPIVRGAMKAATINETLLEIAKEFRPNHGTSLKDVLQNIESSVNETGAELREFIKDHNNVHKDLDTRLKGLANGQEETKQLITQFHPGDQNDG